MTKNKRFYYNTFYHKDDMSRVLEYEIIDRQSYPNYPNHNENEDIPDWYIYIGENDSGWQDMLINLLNQLNDENEWLKKENERLKIRFKEEKDSNVSIQAPRIFKCKFCAEGFMKLVKIEEKQLIYYCEHCEHYKFCGRVNVDG